MPTKLTELTKYAQVNLPLFGLLAFFDSVFEKLILQTDVIAIYGHSFGSFIIYESKVVACG
jgi:hypothetical protein